MKGYKKTKIMKKLLGILAAVSITASSSALVVSCGDKKNTENNKLNLSNLVIKNGLNKINLNDFSSISEINESIIKILNDSYENKYNLKLNDDIKLSLFKDDKMQDTILNYDDLTGQNYVYVKFLANVKSNKVESESEIFEFQIIPKKVTKVDLKSVSILEGLNKFNLNELFSINDVKENAVSILNSALNEILDLKFKDDVNVSIFLDFEGKTGTNTFDDIINKDAIYVQFSANPYSDKIENSTDIFRFSITKKEASDSEIATEVSKKLKNNSEMAAFVNSEDQGISKQVIIDKIKSNIPNEIYINDLKIKKYDKNNVNIFLKDDKPFYKDTVVAYIEYRNFRSEIDLVITITSDLFVINSKKISNLTSHYNEYLAENTSIDVNEINDDVWKNLNNIGITKEKFRLESSIIKDINGIDEGKYEYKVLDLSGKELINYNSGDENNKTTFSLSISTNKLKNYKKLSSSLDEFSNHDQPSSSLRYISLFDFFPLDLFSKFSNSTAITDLLKSITLGNFVDWFFEPTGKYASLMPTTMPKLNKEGILTNENKDFWNYIHTIVNDFKDKSIDVVNELEANFETKINGYDSTVSINIYNLILNIMPDLIHFHNYILNEKVTNEKPNYLLLFIKYLLDDVKDYNVLTETESFKDNFLKINQNTKNLKTNFDSLLHNMIDPFTNELNSDSSKIVSSKIPSPISVVIKTGIPLVGNLQLNWGALAEQNVPSQILFKDIFNKIIENPIGKNINENIDVEFKVTLHFLSFPISVKSNFSLSLSSLHSQEIKSLIKNELHFGSSFNDSKITTEKGRLFLLGKNKNNEWIEIHSLNALIDVSDIKFWFKDFKLKITDSTESSIYLTQTINNFYLEL